MALLLDWLGKRWNMSQIQVLKEETPCWQCSSTSHCLNLTPNQIKHQELPCANRSSCLVAVWSYHDLHSVGGGTKGKGEGRARRTGTRGAPTTDQSWPVSVVSLFWLRCLQTLTNSGWKNSLLVLYDWDGFCEPEKLWIFYLSQEKEREEAAEKEKVARTSSNVG